MRSRFSLGLVLVFLLAGLVTLPASAGGWAVITLDSIPENPAAGQPLEIGFMVRQHGISPMPDLKPTVTATNLETGEQITAQASANPNKTGHYQAVLEFPSPGTWVWTIEAFTMTQAMPALHVSAGSTAAAPLEPADTILAAQLPVILGLLGAAGLLSGLLLFRSRKTRWAMGLGVVTVLFAAAALITALRPSESVEASPVKVTSVETGRDLFIAKGCVVCHTHRRAEYGELSGTVGPALSDYSNSEEFLHAWLKDPQSVRTNAAMPQLELKEHEIIDLIAFLNAGR